MGCLAQVVVDGLERLHAVKRTLQEDLEVGMTTPYKTCDACMPCLSMKMATSGTVNDRLQADSKRG